MSYTVQFSESVKTYFRETVQGLSRSARVKLFAQLLATLADYGDEFRNDLSRRLAEGSPHFQFEIIVLDDEGDGWIHSFLFIVSDAAAPYGVLQVVYAEHRGQNQIEL